MFIESKKKISFFGILSKIFIVTEVGIRSIVVLTTRSMIVPRAITRYRPNQESERKAPKMGTKLDMAFHRKTIIAPVAGSKLYSCSRYNIMFTCSPTFATFSNVSLAKTSSKS